MPESTRSSSLLGPVGIVWLISLVAGFPTASTRNPAPPVVPARNSGGTNWDAPKSSASRLWEDPLEATGALTFIPFKGKIEEAWKGQEVPPPDEKPPSELERASEEHLTRSVFVLCRGLRYAAVAEWRRQQRYAVQAALWARNFSPAHADKLFYKDVSFETVFGKKEGSARENIAPGQDWYLRVPYEDFKETDDQASPRLRVCYINIDLIGGEPVGSICRIAEAMRLTEKNRKIWIASPPSTDWLRAMIWENLPDEKRTAAREAPGLRILENKAKVHPPSIPVKEVDIFNTLATGDLDPEQIQLVQNNDLIVGPRAGVLTKVRIHQLIEPDSKAIELLGREFQNRGIHLGDTDWLRGGPSRVAVVSEWETSFGRNFAKKMSELARAKNTVLQFTYLRGLSGLPPEGRNPGQSPDFPTSIQRAAEAQTPGEALSRSIEPAPLPPPFGPSQFDYVARMGEELRRTDSKNQREGLGVIRAIGLIGTDVDDKLALLKVLRPRFPDALFFTNEMDAEFLQPENNPFTRNLIVATHYSLDEDRSRQGAPNLPSFRTSAQSAIADSIQAALDASDPNRRKPFNRESRKVDLYEVGIRTFHLLNFEPTMETRHEEGHHPTDTIHEEGHNLHAIEIDRPWSEQYSLFAVAICGLALLQAWRGWRESDEVRRGGPLGGDKAATVRWKQFVRLLAPGCSHPWREALPLLWHRTSFVLLGTRSPLLDAYEKRLLQTGERPRWRESLPFLWQHVHLFLLGIESPLLEAHEVRLLRKGKRPPLEDLREPDHPGPADRWWLYGGLVIVWGILWWLSGQEGGRLIVALCGVAALTWMQFQPREDHQRVAWIVIGAAFLVLVALWIGHWCKHYFITEPWALADGVCLWPSVLLRFAAAALAIRFVRLAWEDICLLRDSLTKRFFLEREGGLEGGIRHSGQPTPTEIGRTQKKGLVPRDFPDHTSLDQGSNPAAGAPPIYPNEAVEWDRYLESSDPRRPRPLLRWSRLTIAVLLLSAVTMVIAGLPHANSRGSIAKVGDILSLGSALLCLSMLCVFIGDQLWQCRRFIERIWVHGTTGFGFETEETLLLIARLTQGVGDLIVYPFAVCFVLLCAHSSFFEKWLGLPGLYAMLALALGSLIVLTWRMQRTARTVKDRTVDYLQLNLAEATWIKRLVLQRIDFPFNALPEKEWWRYTVQRIGRHLTLPEELRTLTKFEMLENKAVPQVMPTGTPETEGDTKFHEARIKRIEQLLILVNSIKEGAFGGVQDNPIVRGVLIPSVGLGSLQLIQRLLAG